MWVNQGVRGEWNYDFCPVYVISILNFPPVEGSTDTRIVSRNMIQDTETQEVWTDRLQFIAVEISKFKKPLIDCKSLLDKWFFVLRNLHRLMNKPCGQKRFETIARTDFESSELEYDQMKNALDYAIKDGLAQGMAQVIAQGKVELIQQMLQNGMDWDLITKATGVTPDALAEMKSKLQ